MKAMSLFTALLGAMTCACGAPVTNLEIADFEAKAADPAVFLVDVRTPEEYAEGHLRGAANIDWNAPDFLEQVQAVCPKVTPVAVYCRTGRRSGEASKKLSQAGYAVCNLVGGIEGWQAAWTCARKSGAFQSMLAAPRRWPSAYSSGVRTSTRKTAGSAALASKSATSRFVTGAPQAQVIAPRRAVKRDMAFILIRN